MRHELLGVLRRASGFGRPARLRQTVLACIRVALGASFLWAAIAKLRDIESFREQVAAYRLLPTTVVPLFVACLVASELACGCLLVIGRAVRAAAGAGVLLLVAFIVALTQALLRHLDLACGCFGSPEPASWATVVRDVVMLAACSWLFARHGDCPAAMGAADCLK